jgi:hypothetical protein
LRYSRRSIYRVKAVQRDAIEQAGTTLFQNEKASANKNKGIVNRMNTLQRIYASLARIREIPSRLDDIQKAIGRVELALQRIENRSNIHDNEFKVFSQWGEDGIIQFLLRQVQIPNRMFVEIGVSDYREANTRFLLQNNNWSGLVIDGSEDNIKVIRRDPLYWRYNLKAEREFIERDNTNDILERYHVRGDIGLLSIDIDGNDYWIWETINNVSPRIVICEYRSLFGWRRSVTIPYDRTFSRFQAHPSGLYYGASISALHRLGQSKGYSLVGSNSAGCNLFFVRSDVLGNLAACTPEQVYQRSLFRESRDAQGHLTFLDFDESVAAISDLSLYDLDLQRLIKVSDLN